MFFQEETQTPADDDQTDAPAAPAEGGDDAPAADAPASDDDNADAPAAE